MRSRLAETLGELETDRDSYRVKSEELEEALEASKAREEATSARLAETLVNSRLVQGEERGARGSAGGVEGARGGHVGQASGDAG